MAFRQEILFNLTDLFFRVTQKSRKSQKWQPRDVMSLAALPCIIDCILM